MKERSPVAQTKDAVKIIDSITGAEPERPAMIEEDTMHARVARLIYAARSRAGLTQQQLADLVGTKPSVSARLEDADDEGHSLTLRQRIAAALNQT
jgi:ribosome-binding protein aMBF1 (putative translation factor)